MSWARVLACGALVAPMWTAAARAERLEDGFRQPPPQARPWVYWFWLNGNVSRHGITADLEAMQRAGIGGVLIMEVDQGTPSGPVRFASHEWRALFRHVLAEARRLGLEVNMNNDAGWCGSGGPWVRPDKAKEKVVWSETSVRGPVHLEQVLPQPPTLAGYYRDVAVVAFPTPAEYRLADLEGKTGLVRQDFWPQAEYPAATADQTIRRADVIELTAKMDPAGRLVWDAPAGQWTILRFGHTPTGAVNAPAPESGRGLECDKLSKEAVEAYFDGFLAKLIADAGPLAGRTLVATHIDSWETGSQNWTPHFREEFQRRRGYDLLPYLAVVAGRVVESVEVAERFLWDWRQTISELMVDNYAGHLAALAHQHGLRLSIEAYGNMTCDNLAYAGRADEPMGEFWSSPAFGAGETLVQMASAAHVYGRPIVGAEAFTADQAERWLYHPGTIKAMADRAFCLGINRMVIHRYAHQPWDRRWPGMCMGPWGLHYERTQTWWEQSRPWHEYLARCQYLLREGVPVVDVLCLAPEGAPRSYTPPAHLARAGYQADVCSAEALLKLAKVKQGRLVFPGGASYRLLLLPDVEAMTPELLQRLEGLTRAGATVVGGRRPRKAPGLRGFPQCDLEVQRLAERLWGRGSVIGGQSLQQVLAARGLLPDLVADRPLQFAHRRVGHTEVYFVANTSPCPVSALFSFRVAGKVPELWDPRTGRICRPPVFEVVQGRTRLPLRLEACEAMFVVFRTPGPKAGRGKVAAVTRAGRQVGPPRAAQHRIIIRRALWGPLGDEQRTKDVTAQVQRLVDSGVLSFVVAELAAEGDPAVGVVKTLRVEYEVDGQSFAASATDPQRITLAAADPPPPLRLEALQDGRLVAVAAEEGEYRVRLGAGRVISWKAPPPRLLQVQGPWTVRFPPGWGAPSQISLAKLISWSTHPDPGVRYFSGTASYRAQFELPRGFVASHRRLTLDLGRVEVMARVKLNRQDLGILWKAPYQVDITQAVRAGRNGLEVEVTNLWPNRMIGDEQLPEDSQRQANGTLLAWPAWLLEGKPSPTGRYTFASWRLWRKDEPLLPSGLLGPVTVRSEEARVLE
jgi:hypothetical protein